MHAIHAGSTFDIWAGCYSSPFDPIVLLACVAINGYHGMSSYTWQRDQDVLTSHQTPLVYCVVAGTYTCSVIYDGFVMKCTFKVEGELFP